MKRPNIPTSTGDSRALPDQPLHTEKLAYWFFRLNGCLTIENFIVHPDIGSGQRTDADILGVRFPYRSELLNNPMDDYHIFVTEGGNRPLLFIAEVKSKTCRLNGPWTSPAKKNMERVLRAVGAIYPDEIASVAQALYKTNKYDSPQYAIRLFAIADQVDNPMQEKTFAEQYPNAIPITWTQILRFVHRRFTTYREQKRSHDQWDEVGKQLYRMTARYWDEDTFVQSVRSVLVDNQGRPLTPRNQENEAEQ